MNQPTKTYVPPSVRFDSAYLMSIIKKNWYWFLTLGLLGAYLGYLFNKNIKPDYIVSTTILYKTDPRQSVVPTFSQDISNPKKASIQNQVGVLTSYNLNYKTLQNLNWNYSLYRKSFIHQEDLYQREPLLVTSINDGKEVVMVNIDIRVISENSYEASCNDEYEFHGKARKINFKRTVKFDEPLKNEFFSFFIKKAQSQHIEVGDHFILVFNDYSKLATDYQKKLKVTLADAESDLIYVELKSSEPRRAADYLNELGKVYLQFGVDEKNRVANNTVRFIDNQIAGISDSLNTAGKDFTDFRSRNRIVDLNQEGALVMEKVEGMESQGLALKMKLDYYTNLKQYMNNAGEMKNLMAPSVVGVTDPTFNNLVAKLTELYGKREVLSYTVEEKNPALISLDNEIDYTRKVLSENLTNLLNNTRIELNSLNSQKSKFNSQLSRIPKTEQNLSSMKRNFDLSNNLYTFLLQKRAEAGIARASYEPDAQILDIASLETSKFLGRKDAINVLIGFLCGILIPLIIVYCFIIFDPKLRYPDQVDKFISTPVSGIVFHNKSNSAIPVLSHPDSIVAESFRGLRNNILQSLNQSGGKILSIHSRNPNEGKSFVAVNLAISIAKLKKNVLLIDADIRRPALHNSLNTNNTSGLIDYLSGQSEAKSIIQTTNVDGLKFMSAGHVDQGVAELVNSEKLNELTDAIKDSFDYIVMKNPPAAIVNDWMSAMAVSDLNLFIVRIGSTRLKDLKTIEAHGAVNDKNFKLAVNDASPVHYSGYSRSFNYFKEA